MPVLRAPIPALVLALGLTGCNSGPAQEALAAAEAAVQVARPVLAIHAPGDLADLERALAEARHAFEEGRYTDSLRIAQDLPSRARAAVDAAVPRGISPAPSPSPEPPAPRSPAGEPAAPAPPGPAPPAGS